MVGNGGKMKILVVGCGSIGSRHISNLNRLGIKKIIACDTDEERLKAVFKKFHLWKTYTDFKVAVSENPDLDGAIICTPTSMHLPMAKFLANHGINILVEKPLSTDLRNVNRLLATVKKKNLVLMAAMCYRFNPGLIKLKKMIERKAIGKIYSVNITAGYYLPYWHPQSDYRREYSAKKALGGGVILDGTHSIDLMRWIFGEPKEVVCVYGKLSNLEIDTEDIACFIFVLRNGTLVSLSLDYLKRVYTNKIEVTGEKGNLYWDFKRNEVAIYKEGKWKKERYRFKTNDMYVAELKHFLDCVRKKKQPLIDGEDGKKTIEVVEAAKQSAALKRFVKIGPLSKD